MENSPNGTACLPEACSKLHKRFCTETSLFTQLDEASASMLLPKMFQTSVRKTDLVDVEKNSTGAILAKVRSTYMQPGCKIT